MELQNGPFSGIMVPAKKMPDLRYPHYVGWYRTIVPLSSDPTIYTGHAVTAGRNITDVPFVQRRWHVNVPPARTADAFDANVAMDITTPFYMLASTIGSAAGVEDTIIGPDYYNLPLRLNQDLEAMNQVAELDEAASEPLYIRTIALNHKFHFTNYSRFPLEIYYCVLPVGYEFNVMSSPVATMTIMDDMSGHQTFKKIVIPAVRDAADRGKKRTIDLSISMKSLFPDAYDMLPGPELTASTQTTSTDSRSPWIAVRPGTSTESVMSNIPPGQVENEVWTSPTLASSRPHAGLRLQWYAKLQNPRDLGITTDAAGTGGDYVGNNYDVIADCSWKVEILRTTSFNHPHTGEKAYPSQVA